MKLKKPYCTFCSRTLELVSVDGSAIGDPAISDIQFDVRIDKTGVHASVDAVEKMKLDKAPNPPRHLAEVELYVEERAEEVRCTFCSKKVKLVRILPPPPPDPSAPQSANYPGQLIQQLLQSAQQHMGTNAPIVFAPPTGGAALGSTPNFSAIQTMIDSKFTDAELSDILVDIGELPNGVTLPRQDMLDRLMSILYGV